MSSAQLAASDTIMLRAGGPRLGRVDPSGELVLLLFDQRSADQHHRLYVPRVDAQVYANLVEAGAKAVADTRMLAIGSDENPETAETVALVQTLRSAALRGVVVRDVWPPGRWTKEAKAEAARVLSHQALNIHANEDSTTHARIYPLVTATTLGIRETLPLVTLRIARGLSSPTETQLLDSINQCGIGWEWNRRFPEFYTQTQPLVPAPSDYEAAGLRLPWVKFSCNDCLVSPAGVWINYAVDPHLLPRISYQDAAENRLGDKVRGKIVVIGNDIVVDPSSDSCAVPNSPRHACAAEVVAVAIDTLLQRRWIEPAPTAATLACCVLGPLLGALLGSLLGPVRATLGCLAVTVGYLAMQAILYRAGHLGDFLLVPGSVVVAGLGGGLYRYSREWNARRRVTDLFGRYVPRAVVNQLVLQPESRALALGGVERDVTVLFADIRGFTEFSERLSPTEVLDQLNELLSVMVEQVFKHEGTIDKYIGDAILVLFNAPLDQADHPQRAVIAARSVQQAVSNHPSGLAVGIGIHSGRAVVGTIGTPERMEYTAIGSTVNVASRVCSLARGGEIVVTESVAAGLPKSHTLIPRPLARVKGIDRDLVTYSLQGSAPASPRTE